MGKRKKNGSNEPDISLFEEMREWDAHKYLPQAHYRNGKIPPDLKNIKKHKVYYIITLVSFVMGMLAMLYGFVQTIIAASK